MNFANEDVKICAIQIVVVQEEPICSLHCRWHWKLFNIIRNIGSYWLYLEHWKLCKFLFTIASVSVERSSMLAACFLMWNTEQLHTFQFNALSVFEHYTFEYSVITRNRIKVYLLGGVGAGGLQSLAALHEVLHLALHLADVQPGHRELLLKFSNCIGTDL